MTFPQRRHDLDWVRVFAFGLLVLYHVGMYYVSWDWHVKSPFASPSLEPLMLLSSPWRLSLLFLVSGVATAYLVHKMQGRFLGQRSWRLLVPLAFGMAVVVMPQAYHEVVEKLPGGYHDGILAFWSRYLRFDRGFCWEDGCLDVPTWNHLWFVAYLWVYTVVLWAALRFAPVATGQAWRTVARALSGVGVLFWPALFLVGARIVLVGRYPSTHALVDDWYNHAQYLPLFLAGYGLARLDAPWDAIRRLRWIAVATALPAYAFVAWYFTYYSDALAVPDWVRFAQRVAWGVNQWAVIVAILGFARQWAPGDGPALRYLGAAVFPVYILHQTVIVVLAQQLKPLRLAAAIEGPLLVGATVLACFGGYEVVRRVPVLRPLFGLKPEAPPVRLSLA